MTNDDISGETALFWGEQAPKTAPVEIRMTTNHDNTYVLLQNKVLSKRASSLTLPLLKPTPQFHWGDSGGSSKLLDRQTLLVDQLIDLRSTQTEGFGDLWNGPEQ